MIPLWASSAAAPSWAGDRDDAAILDVDLGVGALGMP